jgi:ferredoxin/DNA-binding MarR family transcriptional regulator
VADLAESDVFEQLRQKISMWPIRFPRTKESMEMLRTLFTEEEARLLTHFAAPYQDRKTVNQLAQLTGKRLENMQKMIDRLVERGLLFRFTSRSDGQIYFALMPVVPGIFEFYLASENSPDEKRRLGALFEKYYMTGGGLEAGASDYPWSRVMPIEKTVTVNKQIHSDLEIFPYEKMSEFITTARKIAVINCACRTKKPCEHPLEACLVFDYYADFMVEKGHGRYLTEGEALQLLDETEQAGLVHSTTNTQTRPQFICNCCTCACMILRGLTELHNPRAVAKSNFLPERDNEACLKCGKCVAICPFEAHVHHLAHDSVPEQILFLEDKCIGCGLCAYHCPTDALTLAKVRDVTPAETPREAFERVEAERVH